jgi:hypothetical protein
METYKTSDLSLAAFLKMKGIKLTRAQKESNGKFSFEFEGAELCEPLSMEFANSEFAIYDANVRALKKALNARSK